MGLTGPGWDFYTKQCLFDIHRYMFGLKVQRYGGVNPHKDRVPEEALKSFEELIEGWNQFIDPTGQYTQSFRLKCYPCVKSAILGFNEQSTDQDMNIISERLLDWLKVIGDADEGYARILYS